MTQSLILLSSFPFNNAFLLKDTESKENREEENKISERLKNNVLALPNLNETNIYQPLDNKLSSIKSVRQFSVLD